MRHRLLYNQRSNFLTDFHWRRGRRFDSQLLNALNAKRPPAVPSALCMDAVTSISRRALCITAPYQCSNYIFIILFCLPLHICIPSEMWSRLRLRLRLLVKLIWAVVYSFYSTLVHPFYSSSSPAVGSTRHFFSPTRPLMQLPGKSLYSLYWAEINRLLLHWRCECALRHKRIIWMGSGFKTLPVYLIIICCVCFALSLPLNMASSFLSSPFVSLPPLSVSLFFSASSFFFSSDAHLSLGCRCWGVETLACLTHTHLRQSASPHWSGNWTLNSLYILEMTFLWRV